jgi:hypothetical protein
MRGRVNWTDTLSLVGCFLELMKRLERSRMKRIISLGILGLKLACVS